MLSSLSHLALEVKYLDRARAWYRETLGMTPEVETDTELRYRVGETAFVLRRPTSVPRGGIHTHYAFSVPRSEYGEWFDRLAHLDPAEVEFGDARSAYVDDPDDHCVELAGFADEGSGLLDVFEIVLEVESVDAATDLYTDLGFEVMDRGEERRRVRLRGPVDLELWEPQLGLADARGGVHVDLGFAVDDPAACRDALGDRVCDTGVADDDGNGDIDGGVRVRDPDGHYLTFRSA